MDHGKFPVILAPVATGTGNEGAERQRAAKKFIKKQLFTKKMYFWTPLDDLYV